MGWLEGEEEGWGCDGSNQPMAEAPLDRPPIVSRVPLRPVSGVLGEVGGALSSKLQVHT